MQDFHAFLILVSLSLLFISLFKAYYTIELIMIASVSELSAGMLALS